MFKYRNHRVKWNYGASRYNVTLEWSEPPLNPNQCILHYCNKSTPPERGQIEKRKAGRQISKREVAVAEEKNTVLLAIAAPGSSRRMWMIPCKELESGSRGFGPSPQYVLGLVDLGCEVVASSSIGVVRHHHSPVSLLDLVHCGMLPDVTMIVFWEQI